MTAYNPEAQYNALMTEEGVACEHPRRPREFIRWDDIVEITIVTNSEGPFAADVWLLLIGKDGGCSISQGAPGFESLLFDRLGKWPGFDYEKVIAAMACTDDARFVCWRRS